MNELKLGVNFAAHLHRLVEDQFNHRLRCGISAPHISDTSDPPFVHISYAERSGTIRGGGFRWRKTWTTATDQYLVVGREWLLKHYPTAIMRALLTGQPVSPDDHEISLTLFHLDWAERYEGKPTPCPKLRTRSEQWAIDAEAEDGRLYA